MEAERGRKVRGGGGGSLTAKYDQNAEPKMGDSEKECVQNVKSSLALFKSLGFVVYPTKSVLIPSHKITYLGFEVDSQDMTVIPTLERKQTILSTASKLLTGSSSAVRELAQFIGQVVSCFQGVKFGPLWYRYMESDKIKALKQNKGDYESKVVFSNEAKSEMIWWTENIMSSFSDVHADHSEPDFVLFTDASLTGCGCSCEIGRTGGDWHDYAEAQSKTNVSELKAALLTLQSFAREKANIHVR